MSDDIHFIRFNELTDALDLDEIEADLKRLRKHQEDRFRDQIISALIDEIRRLRCEPEMLYAVEFSCNDNHDVVAIFTSEAVARKLFDKFSTAGLWCSDGWLYLNEYEAGRAYAYVEGLPKQLAERKILASACEQTR